MRQPRKPPDRQVRPKINDQGAQVTTGQVKASLDADSALTAAWLRVHADLCYAIDPSGQLSAHLRDHADCREALAAGRR
jgi:hypothetical protein